MATGLKEVPAELPDNNPNPTCKWSFALESTTEEHTTGSTLRIAAVASHTEGTMNVDHASTAKERTENTDPDETIDSLHTG